MPGQHFRYDNKRVLIVGGATGMGAAAARTATDLGADVIVFDVADVDYPAKQIEQVDLRSQQDVDAALERVDGPVDAVFSCAGVADGTEGLMLINFISQRHIIDSLTSEGKFATTASVAMISSGAGMGWQNNLAQTLDFLACPDWKAAAAWIEAHPGTDSYLFSKQVVNTYVAHAAFGLAQRGVRINAVLPGPTDTPLAQANADLWLSWGAPFREELGLDPLSPEQVGDTLAFLCSEAASGINGVTLTIDHGHTSAAITGAREDPGVKGLLGIT